MSCNSVQTISQKKIRTPMLLLLVAMSVLLLFSVPVAADDSVGDTNLPSKYDLRDYGLVTSVKDQGDYGTCWAFAAISAIESNAVKQGYETLSTADFSEFQLAYFMYNRDGVTTGDVLPELSGLAGDDIRFKATADCKYYLDVGGSPLQAAYHLATGIGVVRESVVPYSWVSPNRELHNTYAVSKDVYIVSHASFVAYDDMDGIKKNIMDHGCGVVSYFDDEDCYNENARYAGQSSTCYYQNTVNDDTNHVVSIVGWNDAYPKENFKTTPEHDGAWLIKNSWGQRWGDDGYFWLSYDDTSLVHEVVFYEISPKSTVDTIYQYDGTGSTYYRYYESSEVSTMNKFTAGDYETITDVSFVTLNKNLEYEASILNENEQVVSTITGFVSDCGYHTVPLHVPVMVNPGEIFSVRVTLTSSDVPENLFGVTGLSIPLDAYDDWGWVEMGAVAEPDQSYEYSLFYNTDLGVEFGGNLRIKAFAVDRNPDEMGENTTDLSTPISTPVPVSGVLLGLFGAGLLLRRRL